MARLTKEEGRVALIEPDLSGESITSDGLPPELKELVATRLRAATSGVRRLGLGSWDVSQKLESLLLQEGLALEHTHTLQGVMSLTPPYTQEDDLLVQALLSWESESQVEAEASTLRWLASEGGMLVEEIERLERLEREARKSRSRGLRAGTWTGTVRRPMAVVVGRRRASL